jgi:hypothetical protein
MCGGTLSIARRKAGSEVTCPKCEYEITVPEPEEAPAEDELDLAPEPEPEPAPSRATRLKTQARPAPAAPKADLPLFERDDIEKLLEPTRAPDPKPEAPPAPLAVPVADGGLTISYAAAVMLSVLMLVLLGLAFATGYLIGR